MTPQRIIELQCPRCSASHWEMDHDHRGISGPQVEYSDRHYTCPQCGHDESGYTVKQASPPEFFLQPHNMYPMNLQSFKYWLSILRAQFPEDDRLRTVGISWYPGKEQQRHGRE